MFGDTWQDLWKKIQDTYKEWEGRLPTGKYVVQNNGPSGQVDRAGRVGGFMSPLPVVPQPPQGPEVRPVQAEAPMPTANPTMPMPTPTPTLPPMIRGNVQRTPESDAFLKDRILPITNEYGLPPSVVGGQFAGEDRLGGKNTPNNNFFNVNSTEARSGKGNSYPTVEDGVRAYAKLITENPIYAQAWAEYKATNNPTTLIRLIEAAHYAGNEEDYAQRANNGYSRYSDFIMDTPEWKQYYPR
jgi:hypothetical protein